MVSLPLVAARSGRSAEARTGYLARMSSTVAMPAGSARCPFGPQSRVAHSRARNRSRSSASRKSPPRAVPPTALSAVS